MTLVKVCGLRSLADARAAVHAGADWIGFIFWAPGKRYIPPRDAAHILQTLRQESAGFASVGVFVDPALAEVEEAITVCGLDYVQLSGDESAALVRSIPRPTIKALHVRAGQEAALAEVVATEALGADRYLLDTHADGFHGGTGMTFDWAALRDIGPRCLVGGGLRPDNVADALAALAPLGVDVSSGVEFAPAPAPAATPTPTRTPAPTSTFGPTPTTTPTSPTPPDANGKDPQLIRAFLEAVRSYDARPK